MLEYRLQYVKPLEVASWGKDITLVTACFPAKTSKKLNSGCSVAIGESIHPTSNTLDSLWLWEGYTSHQLHCEIAKVQTKAIRTSKVIQSTSVLFTMSVDQSISCDPFNSMEKRSLGAWTCWSRSTGPSIATPGLLGKPQASYSLTPKSFVGNAGRIETYMLKL